MGGILHYMTRTYRSELDNRVHITIPKWYCYIFLSFFLGGVFWGVVGGRDDLERVKKDIGKGLHLPHYMLHMPLM